MDLISLELQRRAGGGPNKSKAVAGPGIVDIHVARCDGRGKRQRFVACDEGELVPGDLFGDPRRLLDVRAPDRVGAQRREVHEAANVRGDRDRVLGHDTLLVGVVCANRDRGPGVAPGRRADIGDGASVALVVAVLAAAPRVTVEDAGSSLGEPDVAERCPVPVLESQISGCGQIGSTSCEGALPVCEARVHEIVVASGDLDEGQIVAETDAVRVTVDVLREEDIAKGDVGLVGVGLFGVAVRHADDHVCPLVVLVCRALDLVGGSGLAGQHAVPGRGDEVVPRSALDDPAGGATGVAEPDDIDQDLGAGTDLVHGLG